MNLHDSLVVVQYLCVTGLFIVCWIIMGRWKNKLHIWLLLSCAAALINNIGYLLMIYSDSEGEALLTVKFSYFGKTWYAFFLFLFITELAGVKVPMLLKKALVLLHVLIYVMILAMPYHKLFYSSIEYTTEGIFPRLSHGNGIFHHLFFALVVLYIVWAMAALLIRLRKEKGQKERRRLYVMIVAVISVGFFFVFQIIGLPERLKGYDVTTLGYLTGTILMLIAIFSLDLLGTGEIAKEFLIDRMSEGVFAVDREGTIQYFNEPAAKLYPLFSREDSTPSERNAVIGAIREAAEKGDTLNLKDRIYRPEESDLIHDGENYGKLYTLVDETEHYRYMEELKEQREIAEKANEAKTRFLSSMSHEIRTPLNAVLGMDELILRETSEKQIRDYASAIMSEGKSLLSLFNEILEFAKAEENRRGNPPTEKEGNDALAILPSLEQPASLKGAEKDKTPFSSHGDESIYHELFHAPDARILVVDDTEINLTVVKGLLKKTGIQVDTAVSGKEALAQAENTAYDAVFIDHMMPEMDGVETLRRLRSVERNRETPAVVLTANAVSGAREWYLSQGFQDYLAKPVDGRLLEEMLLRLIPEEKRRTAEKETGETGALLETCTVQTEGKSTGEKDALPETGTEQAETRGFGEKPGDGEALESDAGAGHTAAERNPLLPGWLYEIPKLDPDEGVKYCGSEESYLAVLQVFHQTGAEKAEEIESFLANGNLKDYTIKVHALKSSARVIGAAELSELARSLEIAGKENREDFIRENTGELISRYLELDRGLSRMDSPDEGNPEIDPAALRDAYQAASEIADNMEYSMMEALLKGLKGYRLPPKDEEVVKELERLLSNLDWEGIKAAAEAALKETDIIL